MDRFSLFAIDFFIGFCYIIGMDIKSFQQRCGITQTEIADRLSVTQATVSSWAMNRTTPTLAQLKQLIFMGMTLGEVFDAETEAFITKKTRPNKKQLCKDVVVTALASVVGGEGKIITKAACLELVLTGLEEICTNHEK